MICLNGHYYMHNYVFFKFSPSFSMISHFLAFQNIASGMKTRMATTPVNELNIIAQVIYVDK